MAGLKGKRKRPRKFSPKSIDYDARIFAYREGEESVSLTTTQGRIVVPMVLGEFQRKHLKEKKPTSATVLKKEKEWYIHIQVEVEALEPSGTEVLGVDCGINTIVATSKGTVVEGKPRQAFRACSRIKLILNSRTRS